MLKLELLQTVLGIGVYKAPVLGSFIQSGVFCFPNKLSMEVTISCFSAIVLLLHSLIVLLPETAELAVLAVCGRPMMDGPTLTQKSDSLSLLNTVMEVDLQSPGSSGMCGRERSALLGQICFCAQRSVISGLV